MHQMITMKSSLTTIMFEQLRDKTRREDPEREETARRSCEDEGGSGNKLRNDQQANVERLRETVWFASRRLNSQRRARNNMEKKINKRVVISSFL